MAALTEQIDGLWILDKFQLLLWLQKYEEQRFNWD